MSVSLVAVDDAVALHSDNTGITIALGVLERNQLYQQRRRADVHAVYAAEYNFGSILNAPSVATLFPTQQRTAVFCAVV